MLRIAVFKFLAFLSIFAQCILSLWNSPTQSMVTATSFVAFFKIYAEYQSDKHRNAKIDTKRLMAFEKRECGKVMEEVRPGS